MIMPEQANLTALDNRAYFLVTDEVLVTDAKANGFPFEQGISSTWPLRRFDQQAILQWHALEDRFPSGGEGCPRRKSRAENPRRIGSSLRRTLLPAHKEEEMLWR